MAAVVSVKVWGEHALFTRPELKVERVSYPFMTPSAARGVLDAILYKPQMRWHVRRIAALRPPTLPPGGEWANRHYRLVSFRRNEIDGRISPDEVGRWASGVRPFAPFLTDADRVQRNSLVLQHVAYRIDATPVLTDRANQARERAEDADEKPGPDTEAKYVGMFQRRVERGQCFHRPYLGIREFAAHFTPADPEERPIAWTAPLGFMLYDVRFREVRPREFVPDRPGFFDAHVTNGVLHCDTDPTGPGGPPPVTVHW